MNDVTVDVCWGNTLPVSSSVMFILYSLRRPFWSSGAGACHDSWKDLEFCGDPVRFSGGPEGSGRRYICKHQSLINTFILDTICMIFFKNIL